MESFIILVLFALIMESVDSSLGMMYGTLLSPILIGCGYQPLEVIPAILLSQAIGGISGTLFHHKFGNSDFKSLTRETKIMLAMVIPGIIAVAFGILIAINLPIFYIKVYIGALVLIMSALCLTRLKFRFAWWKHITLGSIAAFNKVISGGGFGPVTSTGGIIGGLSAKVSIATTTFAELGICLFSFVAYLIFAQVSWVIVLPLCIGAFVGGVFGPYFCSRGNHKILRIAVGFLGIISGIWLFYKILF